MSGRRTSFGKLERERAKKAKAAAKRETRHSRSDGAEEGEEVGAVEVAPPISDSATSDLLEKVEKLHLRFDAGDMSFEDFEEQKNELMSRLTSG